MLPLGSRCLVHARVFAVEGRKISVEGSLSNESGILFAEATALFVTLDPSKFGKLAENASRIFGPAGV